MATPRCMHCGYELTGMRVEDTCPECGKEIWSTTIIEKPGQGFAITAFVLGIISIVAIPCFWVLAIGIAVPALVFAYLARKEAKVVDKWPPHLVLARVGMILAWVCIGLSLGTLVLYALFIFAPMFPIP